MSLTSESQPVFQNSLEEAVFLIGTEFLYPSEDHDIFVGLMIFWLLNTKQITYKELEEDSLKVSAFLIKQGFRRSDAAAIILENRPEWAMIYFGITCAWALFALF